MSLKKRLGRRLISTGIKLAGVPDKPDTRPVKQKQAAKPHTGSVVVEATDEPVTWSEEQEGNIIVVEPDIITDFRRKHG